MDQELLYKGILGGLTNALIGDSMGSATEGMTPAKIREHYGQKVTKFFPPPEGTFAEGREPGQLTDDTTVMLEMVDAMIESDGILEIERVVEHLLSWAENDELFSRFAGPSSSKAIEDLREGKSPYETGKPRYPLYIATCGAAMKVAPAGLAHPGDLDAAIRDAVTMSIPTHNSDVALAGACAVASAVAQALVPGATPMSVIDASVYGATQGYDSEAAKQSRLTSPSMVERIHLATEIAATSADFEQACEDLERVIGCGLPIIETTPVALGLFLAARGDPQLTVIGAVNIGGDADSVATVAGAISGAYGGIDNVDPALFEQIKAVNEIDLEGYAKRLTDLAMG